MLAHRSSLTPLLFIEVHVPSQEGEWSFSTLIIFYCSIINNWIGHQFHNLETSSPIYIHELIRNELI